MTILLLINNKGGDSMSLKTGINKPYCEGVYLSKNEDFIWDYKVFHKNTGVPTMLIAKELRSNEFLGPIDITNGSMNLDEEVMHTLEEKSKLMRK
jgi:hypothetical protein